MKVLSNAIKWFLYITTGILVVATINYIIIGDETIPANTLSNILLSGALTTVVTVIFVPSQETKATWVYVKMLLHYVALCAVMAFCGTKFGWIDFNVKGVIMMSVDVALVYLLAFFAYSIIDRRQANAINKRLKEKYSDRD